MEQLISTPLKGSGTDPREAPAVFRNRHAGRPAGRGDGPIPIPGPPAWKRGVALRNGGPSFWPALSHSGMVISIVTKSQLLASQLAMVLTVSAVLPAVRVHVRESATCRMRSNS